MAALREGVRFVVARLGATASVATLLLLVCGRASAVSGTALARVQADPHYAAWHAALTRQSRPAPARLGPDSTFDCGTYDELPQEELHKHQLRQELIAALERRRIPAGPPPRGAAPWPWAGAPPRGSRLAALDTAGVAVLVDDGRIVYINRHGIPEVDPVQAARAFYAAHDDEYDFLVLFTNFYTELAGGNFAAYHLAVASDIEGIGYAYYPRGEHFSADTTYTGKSLPGRLQSLVHMNDIDFYPDDPDGIYRRNYTTSSLLGHEVGHRWLARVRLMRGDPVLLGWQDVHWSFFFHSGASVVDGNAWRADSLRFRTLDATSRYGPLDLYLMGMMAPAEVPAGTLWYVRNAAHFDPPVDYGGTDFYPGSPPQIGVSCTGEQAGFGVEDIVRWNGVRLPAYPDTQRDFRVAIALVTLDSVHGRDLDQLGRIRRSFASFFRDRTLGRGSVCFDLRALPARILFVHRPQGDVEDPGRPTTVRARVELQQLSLRTRLEDVGATLFYSVGGDPFVEVPMQSATPGEFAGDVPPQPLGAPVRYYLRATSSFPGHEYRWPPDAPNSTFGFRVAADTLPPMVQFLPRSRWSRFAEPPLVRALVRDAHGVAAVRVEYRVVGGGAWAWKPLVVQGTSDIYETRLELPGNLGDVVEYRLVATDVAAAAHVMTAPASGAYALELTRTQVENVEQVEPMWTHRSLRPFGPDQWHREVTSKHSGAWSWKVGPTNNTAPSAIAAEQDATLEGPAVRLFDDAQFSFWHHYAFLLDPFDPRHYAMDGGILEWQDVNCTSDVVADQWWLLLPDGGYTHVIGGQSNATLQWYPVFSGGLLFWTLETCSDDLRRPQLANHTIRFRFRVSTSSVDPFRPARDGWFIDDIVIDPGTPTTAVTLEALQAERRADGVRIGWRARDPEPGEVFRIYRAEAAGAAATAPPVDAGGAARGAVPTPTGARGAPMQAGGVPSQATSAPSDPIGRPTGAGRALAAAPSAAHLLFEQIGAVNAEPGRIDYSFDDGAARADLAYVYRLGLVSRGDERLSQEVAVLAAAPRFVLHPNRPNPFNPSTEIRFELARRGRARLAVYDPSGRHVRDLVDGILGAGHAHATWDGTDGAGRAVASGIYFCRLTSGGQSAVQRLVLLR